MRRATFYGTTEFGGAGFGTVFELVKGSGGTWTEKVLHAFTGGNDGSNPYSPLIFDDTGNLYGTTLSAGPHDYGTVFELKRGSNGSWTENVIYAFTGAGGGSGPYAGLLFDSAGNLYGTSSFTVFELTLGSNGTWTEKTLHTFAGGTDGAYPESGLIFDKAGNLYGATSTGGAHRGTVFESKPGSDGTWTEKILHSFTLNGSDGAFPGFGTLTMDASGNLYGTTTSGGTSHAGTVFEVTP